MEIPFVHNGVAGRVHVDYRRNTDPATVGCPLQAVYDAVETDRYEVIADEITAGVKAALSQPVEALYPQLPGAVG
jgi:hypothetical protein